MRKHFIKTSLAVLPLVAAITFSPITASAHSKVMPDGGRFDQFIMQKQTQMWLKCLETVLKPYIIII